MSFAQKFKEVFKGTREERVACAAAGGLCQAHRGLAPVAHPDPQQHLEGCSKCAKAEKQEFANPLARSILLSSSSSPLSMTDSLVAVIRDSTSFNHKEHDNYTLSIAL